MVRIAIAEDNSFLAHGLIERLSGYNDLKIKHVAANGAILLNMLEQDKNVELILMDIQMPEMDGIEAVSEVKKKYPQVKIIMLTVMDDEESIFASIRNGADGYLLKDIDSDELYAGIQEIMDGGAPMSPSIALKTLKLLRQPLQNDVSSEKVELSPRETEVLVQLSKGLNYNEIADNLNISNGTVRKHVENTYRKLQVRNKVEAIDAAKRSRLI
ncbi:MAG: response regulator transcription factor [bacterium]|nr:response regulator transcription factor [bacterium]